MNASGARRLDVAVSSGEGKYLLIDAEFENACGMRATVSSISRNNGITRWLFRRVELNGSGIRQFINSSRMLGEFRG